MEALGLLHPLQAQLRDGDSISAIVGIKPRTFRTGGRDRAYARLDGHGRVVTQGPSGWGGNSDNVQQQLNERTSRVTFIAGTSTAFAALRRDGSVVTWGKEDQGGNSDQVQHLLHSVQDIASTDRAFAALRQDGRVVCWGDPDEGGDSWTVRDKVRQIAGCSSAFAAVLSSGQVETWGHPEVATEAVSSKLHDVMEVKGLRTLPCFAALQRDGSMLCWGEFEGALQGVAQFEASQEAFAVLFADGNVQASSTFIACWCKDSNRQYYISRCLPHVVSVVAVPKPL